MWSPHCRGLHSVGTLPPSPAPVDSPGDFHLPSHPCFYPCWVPKATLSEPMVPCGGDVEHHCGGGGGGGGECSCCCLGLPLFQCPGNLGVGALCWDAEVSPPPVAWCGEGSILRARVGVSGERWRRPSARECGYRAFLGLIRSWRVLPGPGGSYRRCYGDGPGFFA